jgi:hypothetical protein
MHTIATVFTDCTLPVERTEPATTEAKHDQDELWYARVNSECDCSRVETKCGNKYRSIVERAAQGMISTRQERNKLNGALSNMRQCWSASSEHYSKQSATCDLAQMPRELLPRVAAASTVTPDKWPYISQSTINDVLAMRYVRGAQSTVTYGNMWATLQPRLQQYAGTGAGTVAGAIVTNDCWWTGQVAHEPPSGGRSLAAQQRRHSIV